MATNTTFYLKAGDRWPALRATLKDAEGKVIDLSGATVNFVMRMPPSTPAVDRAATVVDAAGGVILVEWQAGETAQAGQYKAEFFVMKGGVPFRVPNATYLTVKISEALS